MRTELDGWTWLCGVGHRLGGHRCGMTMWSAPCPAAKHITDLKISSRKNTINPKQVSFVTPMNISVVSFSRTAMCGWLSSSWLPKSYNITTHMLMPDVSSLLLLRLKNTEKRILVPNKGILRIICINQKQKWTTSLASWIFILKSCTALSGFTTGTSIFYSMKSLTWHDIF